MASGVHHVISSPTVDNSDQLSSHGRVFESSQEHPTGFRTRASQNITSTRVTRVPLKSTRMLHKSQDFELGLSQFVGSMHFDVLFFQAVLGSLLVEPVGA